MPIPLEMLISAAQNASPTAQGDQAIMQKQMAMQKQAAQQQQAIGQFQQGLESRLNPRIGTTEDSDPMAALMAKLRQGAGTVLNAVIPSANADEQKQRFQVINYKTGQLIGTYPNYKWARTILDRKDNEYGGYAHKIVPINGSSK